ncbi:MAG: MbcA/ParS/Xre antitoxin family protein [Pseudomonas sp.]|nr:MbcA/ParS/Xre antitoxin family protein [Pseudomonas sp.]
MKKINQAENGYVSTEELSRVAVKLFLSIAEQWKLSEEESCILVGASSRTTLHNWRKKLADNESVKLSRDTLERLSYIAGIYKSLQILFTDRLQWQEWVRKPNRDFAGQSALERMLSGRVVALADVRRYLDGWRGAHYV